MVCPSCSTWQEARATGWGNIKGCMRLRVQNKDPNFGRITKNKLTWSLVFSFLYVCAKFQPISASFTPKVEKKDFRFQMIARASVRTLADRGDISGNNQSTVIRVSCSLLFPLLPSFLPSHRTGVKLTEIGWNFADTKKGTHKTLGQLISRYSSEIRVLILYSYFKPALGFLWVFHTRRPSATQKYVIVMVTLCWKAEIF